MKKKKEITKISRKIFLACDYGTKLVWRYSKKPMYSEESGQFIPALDEDCEGWDYVDRNAVEFLLGRKLEPGEMAEVDVGSKAVISQATS